MAEEVRTTKMFWIDMEMTGLYEKKDRILEIAAVITDLNLNPLDEFHWVIHQPLEVLDAMDSWCKKTHGDSGLTKEVSAGKPLAEAEKDLIEVVKKHFPTERIVLSGNSVSQDRKFIEQYMPDFAAHLHYRIIDVSSFKEVFRNKYGLQFDKKDRHRARGDIFESIAELKYYLSFVKVP